MTEVLVTTPRPAAHAPPASFTHGCLAQRHPAWPSRQVARRQGLGTTVVAWVKAAGESHSSPRLGMPLGGRERGLRALWLCTDTRGRWPAPSPITSLLSGGIRWPLTSDEMHACI